MVKTRKKLSVVFVVMSRNSVAFFWKSSPPAHRGETKARATPIFSGFFFFFFVFYPPNPFSHRVPHRSLCRGEVGNPRVHRLRDKITHAQEGNEHEQPHSHVGF